MPTRQQRFVYWQAVWMLGTVVALAALSRLSVELYLTVSLIGLLVLLELTAPLNVSPRWERRLKWVALLGFLGFAYLVVRRILAQIPPGLF